MTLDSFMPDDQDAEAGADQAGRAKDSSRRSNAARRPAADRRGQRRRAQPRRRGPDEGCRHADRPRRRRCQASRRGADAARQSRPGARATRAEFAFDSPLKTALDGLRQSLQAAADHRLTICRRDLKRDWLSRDGRARVEAHPKGDPNDNETLRQFARAVLAVEPTATGGPISILESGNTVIRAFIEAGAWALLSIAILLWIVLRRFTDVLLTLIPLLLAGVVTLEICVLIGMPLNFANIIALPLLLGVGVAFKIYYIMAWRAGQTELLQSSLTRAVHLQRHDDRDRVRQPVAVEPSGHVEHGQVAGAVAGLHARGGGAVSAGADGSTTRGQGCVRPVAQVDDRIADARYLLARPSHKLGNVVRKF